MRYLPLTPEDRADMLGVIAVVLAIALPYARISLSRASSRPAAASSVL